MAWPPRVVEALTQRYGTSSVVHTALPPYSLGGQLVDVSEHPQPDGSVVYCTAGLSEGGGYGAQEMTLHAKAADRRLAELVARVGGSSRERKYVHSGTLPLADPRGPKAVLDGVGFLYAGPLMVDDLRVSLLQLVGLTHEELSRARVDSLYTIEAAFWRDGVGRICEPGRGTSPSLGDLVPVRPPQEALVGLDWSAMEVVDATIHARHDDVEGLRMKFPEAEARILARELGDRLPHPTQLGCLLHALMDFKVEELARPSLRLLQLSPDHDMAPQYYADALAMLATIEGGDHWETYSRFEGDFDAAKAAAAERRGAAGLSIVFG